MFRFAVKASSLGVASFGPRFWIEGVGFRCSGFLLSANDGPGSWALGARACDWV